MLHQLADELAAANDNRNADEKPEHHEQEVAVRRAGNRDHVVNPHRRIGNNDCLDRACKRLRCLHVLLAVGGTQELHGDRQQHEAAECL